MKKVLVAILLCLNAPLYAQVTPQQLIDIKYLKPSVEKYRALFANACYVYNSPAAYYANKPIAGISWRPWTTSGKKIELEKNGKVEKVKIEDMGNVWFSDEKGLLLRPFDNGLYIVVVDGAFCYYVKYNDGFVFKYEDGTFAFGSDRSSGKFFDFYSEMLTGEIKGWSNSVFNKHMDDAGLLEQYDDEKVPREMKDSVWGFESKKLNKRVKYLKKYNEKASKTG